MADALTWNSLNPEIATINEAGELVGVANGQTMITGTLGDFTDTLIVKVEIPEADQTVWDDFRAVSTWQLEGSPTSFNPTLSIPADDKAPVNLLFTYGSGRNKFVQLTKDSLLYSLPEKILIPFKSDAVFDKVIVMIRANNASTPNQITFLSPATNEDNVLEINVKEVFGNDVAIFPLNFRALKFIPTKGTDNGERYITLPGIVEVYADELSDVESITSPQNASLTKFIKEGALYISVGDKTYDALGKIVK